MEVSKQQKPLIVDLEGALVYSNILYESILNLLKLDIKNALRIPAWLFKGKNGFREQVSQNSSLDVGSLSYNPDVMRFLKNEKDAGRTLILTSHTDKMYAEQIATLTCLFAETYTPDSKIPSNGLAKRDFFVGKYGEKGFDYVMGCNGDLKTLESASSAVLVTNDASLVSRAMSLTTVSHQFSSINASWKTYARALRVHQWLKNVLIFIPLLASHQFTHLGSLLSCFIAFLAFSFCASAVYIVNDLLDLEDDRAHPTKCKRPFASGELSVRSGLFAAPLLLSLAVAISLVLPPHFLIIMSIYFLMTTGYSTYWKRLVMIDVVVLAALYTMRILAGAAAIVVIPSFWLLAFSMFIFLSLAIVKRYAELLALTKRADGEKKARGRGYLVDDISMLSSMGVSSGYIAVLVMALYVNSVDVMKMYSSPQLIWAICPILLFWVSRVWIITHRGEMNDDPIVFAIKDNASRLTVAVMGCCFAAAYFV